VTASACDTVRAKAADLALDIVDGEERATLLAHLSTCPGCRDDVRGLGTVIDRLLLVVPPDEPPRGFEERVLARLADQPRPLARRRSRWVLAGLGAAAALLVIALVGASLMRPGRETRQATMVSAKGEVVGEVTLTAHPAGILIAVPGWTPAENKPYDVRLQLRSGSQVELGTLQLEAGYGGYGLGGVEPDQVARVELLGRSGEPICGADL
jgi:anti-sigma factor RsiW